MHSNAVFFVEFLLFGGGALAWVAWEYWSTRPGAKDAAGTPPKEKTPPSPEPPGHAER